jgi:hypothetical protein
MSASGNYISQNLGAVLTQPNVIIFSISMTPRTWSNVQNFIATGQGVSARGPKIACSHTKTQSSLILHCTTAHVVINITTEIFLRVSGFWFPTPVNYEKQASEMNYQ